MYQNNPRWQGSLPEDRLGCGLKDLREHVDAGGDAGQPVERRPRVTGHADELLSLGGAVERDIANDTAVIDEDMQPLLVFEMRKRRANGDLKPV